MTIFQLAIYSCVSSFFWSGDVQTTTCRWDRGEFFSTETLCRRAGEPKIGKPILGFIVEDRKVDRIDCTPVPVTTQ